MNWVCEVIEFCAIACLVFALWGLFGYNPIHRRRNIRRARGRFY